MTINILEYELMYKKSDHVMELIRSYQLLEEDCEEMEDLRNEADDKAEEAESRASELKRENERMKQGIEQTISQLEYIKKGCTKIEMIDGIIEIIQEMEGYADG